MSNEPEFEIKFADTTFYLRILTAERKTYGGGWRGEKVTEEISGRVQISTDPDWKGDTDFGFVKVRGRKYGIEHTMTRLAEDEYDRRLSVHLEGSRISQWTSLSRYSGGYRNDQGQSVKYEAKAYNSLFEIEKDVLTQFEKDNPDWQRVSIRRLFEYERDRKAGEARQLRLEADENDVKAAEWQKRIDRLGA
ncbi:hypothetical protein [Streptomyces sp. NPDC059874]|uniref:hypothetical protein n=1 Tax=Streptomyces sp. NPDC059874 TaxID=3346983 RepID=UPI00365ECBCB